MVAFPYKSIYLDTGVTGSDVSSLPYFQRLESVLRGLKAQDLAVTAAP